MPRSRVAADVVQPACPFWTKTSWLQLGYGIWVNMTIMGIGLSFGFPAVTIPQLREETSSIQITSRDEAWIASVLTLSSPIGSLLCGILMDKYGRKIVLVLCEIPMCVGWLYTGFASTARDIIIGRVIAGVGLGMAITAPRAYITEITLPNMRGVIGALPNLFISLGLTIQAGLGSLLRWTTVCYICGGYALVMMVSNFFLPDTPYFLLLKAQPATASKFKVNLRKFRSSKFNVDAELEALNDFRNQNNIRSLSFKDQIKALFRPSSCRPYGIVFAYILFTQLAGVNVVIMWAIDMLKTANSSLNPNLGNFLLALTRIVFGLLTSILLFKVGRRIMAIVSAIGVGVVSIGLCIYLYMTKEKSIVPQLFFISYIAFATLGYYTLPFLMMFELLPLQIRGLLSGICISQLNLMIFAMNNCYPFVRDTIGLANTMAMFGVFSLIGALILYLILPETKGLTLQEIEEFFNSRRSTPVSQRQAMSDQLHTSMNLGMPKSNLNEKGKKSRESNGRKGNNDPKDEDLKIKSSYYENKAKGSGKDIQNFQGKNKILMNNDEDKETEVNNLIEIEKTLKDSELNLEEEVKKLTDYETIFEDNKQDLEKVETGDESKDSKRSKDEPQHEKKSKKATGVMFKKNA